MEVSQTVRKIISAQTGAPVETLTSELHFRLIPQIDSMRILQIILDVENALNIEMPDDVTFRVQTVGEFESMAERLCREGAST